MCYIGGSAFAPTVGTLPSWQQKLTTFWRGVSPEPLGIKDEVAAGLLLGTQEHDGDGAVVREIGTLGLRQNGVFFIREKLSLGSG